MSIKPFHQRRADRLTGVATPEAMTLSELLAKEFPPSSEDRLTSASVDSWSATAFRRAAAELLRQSRLVVDVRVGAQSSQELTPEVRFKYAQGAVAPPEHPPDAEPIVVTASEDGRIIAYGHGIQELGGHNTIPIIDVDASSRRSSGFQLSVSVAGQEFSVGVGHIVADALISALPLPIEVDATNDSSRYIFKSLGFRCKAGTDNPCLLWLG